MTTEKKNIENLQHLIKRLETDEIHLCVLHLKSAEELIEKKFSNGDYPVDDMRNIRYIIQTLDRGLRLKTIADRRYYSKLIASASQNLNNIHCRLSNKIHKAG